MQREIKYRGKRVDGQGWVYGTYHYSENGRNHYILAREKFIDFEDMPIRYLHKPEVWIVLPESVGQYTGLKDRNGKEIYEGDVISQRGQKNTYVEYYKGKWVIRNDEPKVEWRQELHNKTPLHIEIIGNTIDNPELIKP